MKIHLVFAPPHKIPRLGELAEGRVPGVDRKEQVYMKVLGSILRARLILRERDFHLKDFPWMVKKGFKLMRDGLAAAI